MPNRKAIVLAAVLTVISVLLFACGPSVSQSDYDEAKQQVQAQQQKNAQLQQMLSDEQKQLADAQQKLADAQKQAQAQPQQPQQTQPQANSGVTTLLGAFKPTPAPPAPTPTPLPAGVTPPPAPTKAPPPASLYDPQPYVLYVEVIATTTVSKYGIASTVSCTPSSVFKRGQRMVWRFEVTDTSTGKKLTDKDFPTMTVHLPHGEDVTARFSQRGGGRVPDAPWMWATSWDIPLDYPLGGVDFTIIVPTKDGKTWTWKQPAVISATSDTRPKVVE